MNFLDVSTRLGGKHLSFLIYILHLHVWRLLETSSRFSRMNCLKSIDVVAITVAFAILFAVGINKGKYIFLRET